jgi:hypothetical protein
LAFAVAAAAALLGAGDACTQDNAVRVGIAPSLILPRGVLDAVDGITITVYDATGGVDCANDASGGTQGVSGSTSKVATVSLTKNSCTGTPWCGSFDVSQSDTPRVIAAQASSQGKPFLQGCVKQELNQQEQSVTIHLVRILGDQTCGNKVVEATEQCDPPGGANNLVCDAQCQTKEELISAPSSNGAIGVYTGAKSLPSTVWPSSAAPSGRFVTFWGDKSSPTHKQMAMRVLGDSMQGLGPNDIGPAVAGGSIIVPNDPTQFPPVQAAGNQFDPAGAFVQGKYWVAFDDDASAGNRDIHLRSMDANTLVADQGTGQPLGINGGANGTGEPGEQYQPALAVGPGNVLFIAWIDSSTGSAGKIQGRTFDPGTKSLGGQVELSSGTSNQSVTVAATTKGWVATWQNGSDIMMRTIGSNGSPSAAAQTVSTGHTGQQDHPSVAAIDDRLAIAWADHGLNGADIVVQRFGADGSPVGDAKTAINNLVQDGDQLAPAIAASSNSGGFYCVAWVETGSGHIHARLLDATTGFDFNNVNGQADEFQASLANGKTRNNPSVAIGGAGPFIGIAWERGNDGVYGRRFPSPP